MEKQWQSRNNIRSDSIVLYHLVWSVVDIYFIFWLPTRHNSKIILFHNIASPETIKKCFIICKCIYTCFDKLFGKFVNICILSLLHEELLINSKYYMKYIFGIFKWNSFLWKSIVTFYISLEWVAFFCYLISFENTFLIMDRFSLITKKVQFTTHEWKWKLINHF